MRHEETPGPLKGWTYDETGRIYTASGSRCDARTLECALWLFQCCGDDPAPKVRVSRAAPEPRALVIRRFRHAQISTRPEARQSEAPAFRTPLSQLRLNPRRRVRSTPLFWRPRNSMRHAPRISNV